MYLSPYRSDFFARVPCDKVEPDVVGRRNVYQVLISRSLYLFTSDLPATFA
jgi:hypothetical protein